MPDSEEMSLEAQFKGRQKWMKWYPADWLSDEGVRSCHPDARGLWMDMLCWMHGAPRQGYLETRSGKPVPLDKLARMAGITLEKCEQLVAELEDADVFSIDQEGFMFSRRMVADVQRYKILSVAGRKGGRKRFDPSPSPSPEEEETLKTLDARRRLKPWPKPTLKPTLEGTPKPTLEPTPKPAGDDATNGPEIEPSGAIQPSLQDVIGHATVIGQSEAEARSFYDHFAAQGWMTGTGVPIHNWQAKQRQWHVREQERKAVEAPKAAELTPAEQEYVGPAVNILLTQKGQDIGRYWQKVRDTLGADSLSRIKAAVRVKAGRA